MNKETEMKMDTRTSRVVGACALGLVATAVIAGPAQAATNPTTDNPTANASAPGAKPIALNQKLDGIWMQPNGQAQCSVRQDTATHATITCNDVASSFPFNELALHIPTSPGGIHAKSPYKIKVSTDADRSNPLMVGVGVVKQNLFDGGWQIFHGVKDPFAIGSRYVIGANALNGTATPINSVTYEVSYDA